MILPVTNTLNRRKIISRIEFFYILIEKTNVKRNNWKTQWNPKQLRILYSNVNVRKKTLLHSFTFILFFFSRRNRSHSHAHALNVWKSVVTSCVSRNKMKMSNECIYRASPCTNLPTLKSFQEPFSLDPSKKNEKKKKDRQSGDWWKYLPMGFRKHGTLLTVCTGVRRNFRRAVAWKLGGSKFIPG